MPSDRRSTVAVDVSSDGVRSPVAADRLAELARRVLRAERARDAMISIALVSEREIARLNREHLGHRGPTDVISFGLTRSGDDMPVVGDIYICPEVARANARAHGAGVREEVARLVVHGVLHVLGHEHPEDVDRTASPMWRRQERYLDRFFRPGER